MLGYNLRSISFSELNRKKSPYHALLGKSLRPSYTIAVKLIKKTTELMLETSSSLSVILSTPREREREPISTLICETEKEEIEHKTKTNEWVREEE